MAITSIGTYVPTATEFVSHWTDVNADRVASGGSDLLLKGGYSLADFTAQRDALQSAIDAIEGLENARVLAAGDRDSQKENLLERLRQFRGSVRLHMDGTSYDRATPTLPQLGAAESKFLRPMVDMEDLWQRINAATDIPDFTAPLLLRGGYTVAGLQTDIQTLRTAFQAVADAENDLEVSRKQRDDLLDPLRERMLQYRTAIEVEYGEGHPFFDSLPDVSPSPGSTPDPVTASGVWDSGTDEAVITWTESDNPNLDHYEVRMTPGATYDTENDSVISSNLPAGVLELRTDAGVGISGDVASFKVYVVLTTANEAGSNTVTITRP